jgi:hypothetical protein
MDAPPPPPPTCVSPQVLDRSTGVCTTPGGGDAGGGGGAGGGAGQPVSGGQLQQTQAQSVAVQATPTDACPNIDGAQPGVPNGMSLDKQGRCVTPQRSVTLVVNRSGNGVIVSTPAGIRCGRVCSAKFPPGTKLKLSLRPAKGFKVAALPAGCVASNCRFTLNASRKVLANFRPQPGTRTLPLELKEPSVQGGFDARSFKGRLVAAGKVGAAAVLTVRVEATGRAKPVAVFRFPVEAGRFRQALVLPATMAPGSYQVTVAGSGRGLAAAELERSLTLAPPPLGLLGRAWTSAARHGPAAASLPGTDKQVWAYFHYIVLPEADLPLSVTWYAPGGKKVGAVGKPPAPTIESVVGSTSSLTAGTWEAVLSARGKALDTVTVTVK